MAYTNIDKDFREVIETAVKEKKYIRIHYYSDVREFFNVMSVASDLIRMNNEEYLQLASGEQIRIDRISRIDDHIAPPFAEMYEFSCDC